LKYWNPLKSGIIWSAEVGLKNFALGGVPAAEDGDGSSLLVHFPLPFARWYDDLVFT
jgi:hypothetical protein